MKNHTEMLMAVNCALIAAAALRFGLLHMIKKAVVYLLANAMYFLCTLDGNSLTYRILAPPILLAAVTVKRIIQMTRWQ